MTTTLTNTSEVRLERTIPAAAQEVFDAWLDPEIPGSPWHENERLIVNPGLDGLWHWLSRGGVSHYGRFMEIDRPHRVRYSWMSRYTLGEESLVTVTFEPKGEGTLLRLLHSGLPNDEMAKAHDRGWTSISDKFVAMFVGRSPPRA